MKPNIIIFFVVSLIFLPGLVNAKFLQFDGSFAPSDRINKSNILVYSSKVVVNIKDFNSCSWSNIADTNSMLPFVDKGSSVVICDPRSVGIKEGDVISYNTTRLNGNVSRIMHRVIFAGKDQNGTYYKLKGDNLEGEDPWKVREYQVNGVVVMVIY